MPKFVAMLRVKDGARFVPAWLQCFEALVDEIVVLDNGSGDDTVALLSAHPKVVSLIHTTGYNEGRDKNLLYTELRSRKPDWCIWVDIDEVFEPGLTRADFDRLMAQTRHNQYAFRRFHFIDNEHFAGSWFYLNYSSGHDRIMWREDARGYFEDLILDSPNVKGIPGLKIWTNFRLKHMGYISKELVDQKAAIYRPIIAQEKLGSLNNMYVQHHRKMRWHDHRHHPKVFLINTLLYGLQFRHLAAKAVRKISKKLKKSRTTGFARTNMVKQ